MKYHQPAGKKLSCKRWNKLWLSKCWQKNITFSCMRRKKNNTRQIYYEISTFKWKGPGSRKLENFGKERRGGHQEWAANLAALTASLFFIFFSINQSLFAPRIVSFFTNKFYCISLMEQELSTNPSGLYRESPCYTVWCILSNDTYLWYGCICRSLIQFLQCSNRY